MKHSVHFSRNQFDRLKILALRSGFYVRSKAVVKLPVCFETDVGYLKRNFNSH